MKLKTIQTIDSQTCWDIQVRKNSNFFANGVLVHNSNGAIVLDQNGISCQSRNNIITPESDNAGFAAFVAGRNVEPLFEKIKGFGITDLPICIFGEWAGKGIQKGVAVSELDRMFVVFGIKAGEAWLSDEILSTVKDPENRIFNILDFQTFNLEIDFQNPEIAQNEMIKLVEFVENECPVGKAFGVSGTGEGIVWAPADPAWRDSRFVFKTKGERHSVSKVKTLAAIDVEKVNSVNELIDKVVTENRMLQGVSVLKETGEVDRKRLGELISWVCRDVIAEETDTIEASGLSTKDVGGPIAKKVREWFFSNELSL